MITNRTATDTTNRTQRATIWDGGARGVTIGHLRAFLDQVAFTDLDDDTRVQIKDELSASGSWHTVEITASRSASETVSLDPAKVSVDA